MSIVHVCAKCGALEHPLTIALWGRTQESTGYGPHPVCTQLVEDPHAPVAIDKRTGETSKPVQVCRGQLVATQISSEEADSLAKSVRVPRPITLGGR